MIKKEKWGETRWKFLVKSLISSDVRVGLFCFLLEKRQSDQRTCHLFIGSESGMKLNAYWHWNVQLARMKEGRTERRGNRVFSWSDKLTVCGISYVPREVERRHDKLSNLTNQVIESLGIKCSRVGKYFQIFINTLDIFIRPFKFAHNNWFESAIIIISNVNKLTKNIVKLTVIAL